MKITITKEAVTEALKKAMNLYLCESSDHNIYTDEHGNLDIRHDAEETGGWIKIFSLYNFVVHDDENVHIPSDEEIMDYYTPLVFEEIRMNNDFLINSIEICSKK
jgi:hypothetical protein